jgi:hypothetical protein
MRRRMGQMVAAATLLAFSSACSLLMRRVDSSYRPEDGDPACSGNALPVVDTVAATGLVVFGAVLLTRDRRESTMCQIPGCADMMVGTIAGIAEDIFLKTIGALSVVVATVYTLSAVRGYLVAGKCRRARAEYEIWARAHPRPRFVPQLPRSGVGSACVAHAQCGSGNGCDPTTHRCVELP